MHKSVVAPLLAVVALTILVGSSALRPEAYAHIYVAASPLTVTCALQDTYYEIPTWEVGVESGIDGQTDGDIVCTVGGVYKVSGSCSFDGVNAHEYDYCLFQDGAEVAAAEAENTAKTGAGLSVASFSCVTACAAGASYDVRVADGSGTGDVHLHKCQLNFVRIGP